MFTFQYVAKNPTVFRHLWKSIESTHEFTHRKHLKQFFKQKTRYQRLQT